MRRRSLCDTGNYRKTSIGWKLRASPKIADAAPRRILWPNADRRATCRSYVIDRARQQVIYDDNLVNMTTIHRVVYRYRDKCVVLSARI